MKNLVMAAVTLLLLIGEEAAADTAPIGVQQQIGIASWYGEAHRGKLMANGKPFVPEKLTAATWDYALGTKLRVRLAAPGESSRRVEVIVSDRGPAKRLVAQGRVIDLSRAAFEALAAVERGLVQVVIEEVGNTAAPAKHRNAKNSMRDEVSEEIHPAGVQP